MKKDIKYKKMLRALRIRSMLFRDRNIDKIKEVQQKYHKGSK